MRVFGWQTLMRNESKRRQDLALCECTIDRSGWFPERFEYEHIRQDPKDGELCLTRVKSEETLMEARSETDVQIVRRSWVQGRKTNRTIQQLVSSEVSLRIAGT